MIYVKIAKTQPNYTNDGDDKPFFYTGAIEGKSSKEIFEANRILYIKEIFGNVEFLTGALKSVESFDSITIDLQVKDIQLYPFVRYVEVVFSSEDVRYYFIENSYYINNADVIRCELILDYWLSYSHNFFESFSNNYAYIERKHQTRILETQGKEYPAIKKDKNLSTTLIWKFDNGVDTITLENPIVLNLSEFNDKFSDQKQYFKFNWNLEKKSGNPNNILIFDDIPRFEIPNLYPKNNSFEKEFNWTGILGITNTYGKVILAINYTINTDANTISFNIVFKFNNHVDYVNIAEIWVQWWPATTDDYKHSEMKLEFTRDSFIGGKQNKFNFDLQKARGIWLPDNIEKEYTGKYSKSIIYSNIENKADEFKALGFKSIELIPRSSDEKILTYFMLAFIKPNNYTFKSNDPTKKINNKNSSGLPYPYYIAPIFIDTPKATTPPLSHITNNTFDYFNGDNISPFIIDIILIDNIGETFDQTNFDKYLTEITSYKDSDGKQGDIQYTVSIFDPEKISELDRYFNLYGKETITLTDNEYNFSIDTKQLTYNYKNEPKIYTQNITYLEYNKVNNKPLQINFEYLYEINYSNNEKIISMDAFYTISSHIFNKFLFLSNGIYKVFNRNNLISYIDSGTEAIPSTSTAWANFQVSHHSNYETSKWLAGAGAVLGLAGGIGAAASGNLAGAAGSVGGGLINYITKKAQLQAQQEDLERTPNTVKQTLTTDAATKITLKKSYGQITCRTLPEEQLKIIAFHYNQFGYRYEQSEKITGIAYFYSRKYFNYFVINNIKTAMMKNFMNNMIINYFNELFNKGVRLWKYIPNTNFINNYDNENWEIEIKNE